MNVYIRLICAVVLASSLCGCSKGVERRINAYEVVAAMRGGLNMENGVVENLLDGDNAERYGMAKDGLVEGFVYYDGSDKNADKIIVVRAKDEDSLVKIETALAGEKRRLFDALEGDEKQADKADHIVTKTYGLTTALIISEDYKKAEEIFDGIGKGSLKH